MTNAPQLEARLRAALAARSAATPGVEPPSTFTPPRRPPSPSRTVPTVAIAVGLAAAAVAAVAVVVGDRPDDADRVVAAEDAAVPTTTAPEAPLLGPLPAVLLARPSLAPHTVEVSTGPASVADPGTARWRVQAFGGTADTDGRRLLLLTLPYLDADGPDDIEATYTPSNTQPVTVQGSPARLQVDGNFRALWWPGGGPGGTLVTAIDVSADDLLAFAEGLVPRTEGGGGAGGWDIGFLPPAMTATVDGDRGSGTPTSWWRSMVQYAGGPTLSIGLGGPVELAEMVAPRPDTTYEPITVLGHPGVLIGSSTDQTVIWRHSDTVIGELWLTGSTRDDAVATVAALREVTEAEWLASLPDDTLTPTDQADLVAEVGPGTPLPAGTDWAAFLTADGGGFPAYDTLVVANQDYEPRLGRFAVCAWERTWLVATDAGDQAAADAAEAALQGSSSWSVARLNHDFYAGLGLELDGADLLPWDREAIESGDADALRSASASCHPL